MSGATLTDSASGAHDPSPFPLGLTLVYSGGLARAGEQLSLAGRSALLLGRDEPLFSGTPLADPRMSARHAALAYDGARWLLVDPGSKNGTFVNGERINRHTLSPGDAIRLGSTFIVFSRIAPGRPSDLHACGARMAEVEDGIALVAPTDHTVLLLGESGSGKEVVAHAIHRKSGRAGPLLAINCASLRGELLESELFGHVRGAFTGALKSHDGIFVRARAGTVFLDEIGEMEEAAQARLLRVLETRAIRPVGATEEVPVSARVVAATNRPLDALVAEHHLRADLYARLSRWTIALPPLRERKEDLGLIVRAILAREAPGLSVGPELMAALLVADWPLNVRGLVNVLSAAHIAQPHTAVLELTERVRQAIVQQSPALSPGPSAAPPPSDRTTRSSQPAPDRAALEALLTEHQGNVARVASALGLSRQSLYRLLERFALDATRYRS